MRLIKNNGHGNLHLTKDLQSEIPRYAILSHTWAVDNEEEVTYQDMVMGSYETTAGQETRKAGWKKIDFCRTQTKKDNIQHFWIDTCCIDKASSAELQEAINSMFRWYRNASKCYVYMADVPKISSDETSWETAFQKSRWFQRGWTLQELLAPMIVEFYSKEGAYLGSKLSLKQQIHNITGIPIEALQGQPLREFPVNERLCWVRSRETSRQEDKAYSMLGIFDIHMPLLYGEGEEKAFRRLKEEIGKLNSGLSMEEDRCLQSFYPSGIGYDEQKIQNPKRVPDTCLWTLQNPKYLEWRDNDTKKLLWISADPGCGKSVLARCIIDEDLPSALQKTPPTQVLYHFFKDTSNEQRSASRAISSVLHQLFVYCPHLIRHALPKYKEKGAALSTVFSELWSIFTAAATDQTAGDVICVLDALDECSEQEQPTLIGALEDFCLHQQSPSSAFRVKFLVTSRPYFGIRRKFDNLLQASNNIELAGNDESASIKKEIDLVIKHRIADLKQDLYLDQRVSDHLEKRLLETEHRTYLWLHLLWNIIEKRLSGTKAEMDQLIDNLPDDIQGSYEVLLQKCPDLVFARKVLQIVLVASRPLTLDEMDVALHMNEQTSSYADLELEGPLRLQKTLPSRCGLMVSIVQSKVYFIHQTVKEFLLGKVGIERPARRVWQQSLDSEESHRFMTMICLRSIFISQVNMDQANLCNALLPEKSREMSAYVLCQSYMFLSYSAVYWADHFRDQKRIDGIQIVERLLNNNKNNNNNNSSSSVTDRWGDDCGTILHVASLGGHQTVVQLLLDNGADVNAQGGYCNNTLQAASEGGHQTVVQLLLNNGADVNAQGGYYGNALNAASERGHQTVVQLLLNNGADVNAPGGHYGNALQAASSGGHQTTVQTLLDRRVDVNAQGGFYGNALQAASEEGYQTIVQILLDNGADVNAQGGRYGNALQAASFNGHQTVVQTLLDREADVNAQGGVYGNALQAASEGGHQTVVQLLLDNGADVNAQGGHYGNALQAASERGHQTVVQLLLDNGADVNAQGGHYDNAQGGHYNNALQAASEAGHQTVVQLLLDNGAI